MAICTAEGHKHIRRTYRGSKGATARAQPVAWYNALIKPSGVARFMLSLYLISKAKDCNRPSQGKNHLAGHEPRVGLFFKPAPGAHRESQTYRQRTAPVGTNTSLCTGRLFRTLGSTSCLASWVQARSLPCGALNSVSVTPSSDRRAPPRARMGPLNMGASV